MPGATSKFSVDPVTGQRVQNYPPVAMNNPKPADDELTPIEVTGKKKKDKSPKNEDKKDKQENTDPARSIKDFRTALMEHQGGVLPKHSFHVVFSQFSPQQGASKYLNNYLDVWKHSELVVRCESAQLPGVTALKDEVRRFGYGPVEESVYGMQFQDMTLGFIVSKNSFQFKFFNEWMNFITNFASKGGGDMMNLNRNTAMLPYQVSYKDDYANRQMNIFVYDRANKQTLVYEIYDVFPIGINAVDVSYGDTDQLLRLYVRFAYTDYTVQTPQLPIVAAVDQTNPTGKEEKDIGNFSARGVFSRIFGRSNYNSEGSSADSDKFNSSPTGKDPPKVDPSSDTRSTFNAQNSGNVPKTTTEKTIN